MTKFRGNTLTEARLAAEASLGPQVELVKKRKVKRPGFFGLFGATEFEVEAVVPKPEFPIEPVEIPLRPNTRKPLFAPGVYDSEMQGTRVAGDDVTAMLNELRTVRAMLFRMSNNPPEYQRELLELRRIFEETRPMESQPARVQRLLSESGIDGKAARSLSRSLKKVADDPVLYDTFRELLSEWVAVSPWPLANDERKVVAVVGPPGVGKTTTAAKIAARAITEHNKTVTFVAADTYRIGAVDQLAKYAQLLRANLTIVETPAQLHSAIAGADTDMVIVDTSGRGPTGDEYSVEAALGKSRLEGDESCGWEGMARQVLLCLPASLRAYDADPIIRKFQVCDPTSICVTKLDMTSGPGGLINGTISSRLPVSTLCMGQRVPEDIAPATVGGIVDYLAPRNRAKSYAT